jgi:hypothetical protein
MPNSTLRFSPITEGDFRSFWSVSSAWGRFERKGHVTELTVCDGSLSPEALVLPYYAEVDAVTVDGAPAEFTFSEGRLSLAAKEATVIRVEGK